MLSLQSFGSQFAAMPTTKDEAKAILRAALSRLNMGKNPGADLLVVGETGAPDSLMYDEGNKVLVMPKGFYDDLFTAFQVLGAKPPWMTTTLTTYVTSPLGKTDLIKRLQAVSASRTIYFALSTSNVGITPSKDVIGEIADFYSGLFNETPPKQPPAETPPKQPPASRPSWLIPVLVGGSVLIAGIATVAVIRR
jgi:hypothetical protein